MKRSISHHAGIYIHIPFCIKKCAYCDFYSVEDLSLKHRFVQALLKELELRADPEMFVDTIYLGGGTPSLLSVNEIEKIMTSIACHFKVTGDVQVTMEVNPGTLSGENPFIGAHGHQTESSGNDGECSSRISERLKSIREQGINRLSIGVQSFQEDKLQFLNRVHSADTAMETLRRAGEVGFEEVGIDLIYGLPGETDSSWRDDLDVALGFNPKHLSCYMLTYEPGTPMFRQLQKGKIFPLEDEGVSSLFKRTSTYLAEQGFLHYEVSNFASAAQYESRHNRKYWNMVPYLGFGPSAHSYNGRNRSWNAPDVSTYISRLQKGYLPVAELETLTPEQEMMEMVMLGLRTKQGIDIQSFEYLSRWDFQIRFDEVIKRVRSRSWGGIRSILPEDGRTGNDPGRFCLNLDGWCFLDTVTAWFVDKI